MQKLYTTATINETTELLQKSRMQIYRLRKRGKLEFYQAGKTVTFSHRHIEKYHKAITQKSSK